MLLDIKRKEDVWFFEGAAFFSRAHTVALLTEILPSGEEGGNARRLGAVRGGPNLGLSPKDLLINNLEHPGGSGILHSIKGSSEILGDTSPSSPPVVTRTSNRAQQQGKEKGGRRKSKHRNIKTSIHLANTVQASYYSLFINYYFTPGNLLHL